MTCAFYNSHRADHDQVARDVLGNEIADSLGVKYLGYQPAIERNGKTAGGFLSFEDPQTHGQFCGISLETARERLEQLRAEFRKFNPVGDEAHYENDWLVCQCGKRDGFAVEVVQDADCIHITTRCQCGREFIVGAFE